MTDEGRRYVELAAELKALDRQLRASYATFLRGPMETLSVIFMSDVKVGPVGSSDNDDVHRRHGPTGPIGPTGPTGSGSTGPTGSTGSTGPTGTTGPSGSAPFPTLIAAASVINGAYLKQTGFAGVIDHPSTGEWHLHLASPPADITNIVVAPGVMSPAGVLGQVDWYFGAVDVIVIYTATNNTGALADRDFSVVVYDLTPP